jgi:hypothetical protein
MADAEELVPIPLSELRDITHEIGNALGGLALTCSAVKEVVEARVPPDDELRECVVDIDDMLRRVNGRPVLRNRRAVARVLGSSAPACHRFPRNLPTASRTERGGWGWDK